MKRADTMIAFGLFACALATAASSAADEPPFDRKEDVIYARKFGTALTMDVFTPRTKRNNAGIIFAVSGGFRSSHEAINPAVFRTLLDRGYTVFAVVHGSQPRYTVPEIVEDMNKAVRFIRYHAKDYGIDKNRLGICGASAGGHLSLMLGTAGDKGKSDAKDPVDRESSRVQAVACFFPAADLLNFGQPGREMLHATDHGMPFRPAFDYHELDKNTNVWVQITDTDRLREITRQISPITHVSADDPPTLIIHGDADQLVPLQQSETFVTKMKGAGVPTKLVIKKGAGHGWMGMDKDLIVLADWFDEYIGKPTAAKTDK